MSGLADHAVAYAARGMATFPLMPREKKPYGRTPGLDVASKDIDLVAAWWAGAEPLPLKPDVTNRRPVVAGQASNVALAAGEISGFWVLDLDGPKAETALAALVGQHGPLPDTPEQITGKGRQLLFAWTPDRPVRNMSKKSRTLIGDDIDVRGDRGYIVAPPSVHPGDPDKGVPPGRIYAWRAGRSPFEMDFAAAPCWLLDLVEYKPEPVYVALAGPLKPRVREGRASPYGEKSIDNACAALRQARPGTRNDSLWIKAIGIGQLIAGGEIYDVAYAVEALRTAGRDMCSYSGAKWTDREESTLSRGVETGKAAPKSAPERHGYQSSAPKPQARSAADIAVDLTSARSLWDTARPADCKAFRQWLSVRHLEAEGLGDALQRLRAHPRAPLGREKVGPAILVPLTRAQEPDAGEELDALAVLPLFEGAERLTHFVGDPTGKVAMLTRWPADGTLLVSLDLQDAWALGADAGEDMGVVVAPTLRAFAGGYLGDRYGRADPETPHADPDEPPWTAPGARDVWLALRGDLHTPEIKSRKLWGGTSRAVIEGDAAARFYAGLAEQAWRRSGARAARILMPSKGVGFSERWREA
jgi:hypothetical protein